MVTIAIYAFDGNLRRQLEATLRTHPGSRIVGGAVNSAGLLKLLDRYAADVVVAEAPPDNDLAEWRRQFANTAFVVIADAEAEGLGALAAGAQAVLSRSASEAEIAAAIAAAQNGLAVLPQPLLAHLLAGGAIEGPEPPRETGDSSLLTPRELEVLAAMADGASNKAIARRLGISYHTVKFHVAAILTKLDADSRTEAVARAAHLGLVML
jgi:DNA-binding NarL/FixJ family response regulator